MSPYILFFGQEIQIFGGKTVFLSWMKTLQVMKTLRWCVNLKYPKDSIDLKGLFCWFCLKNGLDLLSMKAVMFHVPVFFVNLAQNITEGDEMLLFFLDFQG